MCTQCCRVKCYLIFCQNSFYLTQILPGKFTCNGSGLKSIICVTLVRKITDEIKSFFQSFGIKNK
jgi:hypothetical protein